MSLSRIFHHSHLFTRLEIYLHFYSNTIQYGFWPNFQGNTIEYVFWPTFHHNFFDYVFWLHLHHNTIDDFFGQMLVLILHTMDFGLVFFIIIL